MRAVAYGTCDTHKAYATKPAARRGIRDHVRLRSRGYACHKCSKGDTLNAFPCDVATNRWPHWHIGHTPKGWIR